MNTQSKKIKANDGKFISVAKARTLDDFIHEIKTLDLFHKSDEEHLKNYCDDRSESEAAHFLKMLTNLRLEQQKITAGRTIPTVGNDNQRRVLGNRNPYTNANQNARSDQALNGSFERAEFPVRSEKTDLPLRIIFCIDKSKKSKLTNIPAWQNGVKKFIRHCITFVKQGRLSLASLPEHKSLLVQDFDKLPSNSNSQEVILDPLSPYRLLPSYIRAIFKGNLHDDECFAGTDIDYILGQISNVNKQIKIEISETTHENNLFLSKPQDYHHDDEDHDDKDDDDKDHGDDDRDDKDHHDVDDDLVFARFRKLIYFFNKIPIPHFTHEDIKTCRDKLNETCAGFQYYANKIYQEFIGTLTSSTYELPKGILFYGPPRTGKTHCSREVLRHLKIYRIHPDLAAGDFSKPLQGQSEQMINKIAERCDVLPWELCALFVDEIDGICPNRMGENVSSETINVISVFLSVMDGNKRKKNLIVVGTSNRLEKMDKAFLDRMDIKLFIGLPDMESKMAWIERMVEKIKETLFPQKDTQERIRQIKTVIKRMKEQVLPYTMNLTADAMKKSFGQIMTNAIKQSERWGAVQEKALYRRLLDLVSEDLNRICLNDKIFISSYTPPALVTELKTLDDSVTHHIEWDILKKQEHQSEKRRFAKRILIDLKEQASEQFQLEVPQTERIGENQINFVESLIAYLVSSELSVDRGLCFYEGFKNVFSFYYDEMDQVFRDRLNHPENFETLHSFFREFAFVGGILTKLQKDDQNNAIETFGLAQNEVLTSAQHALKILTKMAVNATLNYVVVLDTTYFLKAGLTSDDAIAKEIAMVVEEATKYPSCLVIFDLDSIADLTKEYTGLVTDLKTSSEAAFLSEKNEPQFSYKMIREKAFRAALESLSMIPNKDLNHWFVAISSNNKLTLDLKEKANWPATKAQKKAEHQIWMRNVSQICKICRGMFREKDNEHGACKGGHYSKYLYDEDQVNELKADNKDDPAYNPFKDRAMLYIPSEKIYAKMEEMEQSRFIHTRLSNYKWECCGNGVSVDGCRPGLHQAKQKNQG